MSLDGNQQALIAELMDGISAQAAAALSKLLNVQVSINLSNIGEAQIHGATANVSQATVLASSALAEAGLHNLNILASVEHAKAIANLMTGSDTELDETGLEAVKTAIAESIGAAINKTAELKANAALQIQGFEIRVLNPADPGSLALDGDDSERIALEFTIQSESGLQAVVIAEISMELTNALLASFGADAGPAKKASRTIGASATVGDVLGTDFAQIMDSHDPNDVDESKNLNLLMDIRLGLIVELGRAEMHLRDILKLTKGSIIELDRLSGESVDLFVNNKLIARGEVVVIDDNFGLRITQLAGSAQAAEVSALLGGE